MLTVASVYSVTPLVILFLPCVVGRYAAIASDRVAVFVAVDGVARRTAHRAARLFAVVPRREAGLFQAADDWIVRYQFIQQNVQPTFLH